MVSVCVYCVCVCVYTVCVYTVCVCAVCGCDLAQGGFFMKGGEYLCTLDYQRLHGTRCHGCGDFVEGEVVTALGKTYHPACFICSLCRSDTHADAAYTHTHTAYTHTLSQC